MEDNEIRARGRRSSAVQASYQSTMGCLPRFHIWHVKRFAGSPTPALVANVLVPWQRSSQDGPPMTKRERRRSREMESQPGKSQTSDLERELREAEEAQAEAEAAVQRAAAARAEAESAQRRAREEQEASRRA